MNAIYENIIDRPRLYSKRHPQMPNAQRAAQFAPFAALSGYEEAVREEARLTQGCMQLAQDRIEELNQTLCEIAEHILERPLVSVTYYKPDSRKAGGEYVRLVGNAVKVDTEYLTLADGNNIEINCIYNLDIHSIGIVSPHAC